MIGNGKPSHSILHTFAYNFIYFSHISSIITCIICKIRKNRYKISEKLNKIYLLKEFGKLLKEKSSYVSFFWNNFVGDKSISWYQC